MSIKIVTGYTGTNHITSTDDRSRINGLVVGETDSVVRALDVGTKFNHSLSGTTLTIGAGEGLAQGVHFRIPYGSYEQITLPAGSQGMNRIDIVGVMYTKNTGTGVESIELTSIKGTATSGTPQLPSYTFGDLYHGDTEGFFPMFIVRFSGTSIASVTRSIQDVTSMVDMASSITDVRSTASDNASKIGRMESEVSVSKDSSFGAGTFGCYISKYYMHEIIYLNMSLPTMTAGTRTLMCTLPEDYRPRPRKLNITHITQSGGVVLFEIETSGAMYVTPMAAVTNGTFVRGTFAVPTGS